MSGKRHVAAGDDTLDALRRHSCAGSLDFLAGGDEMAGLSAGNHSGLAPGRTESWPESLRTMVRFCLECPFPARILWETAPGPICNDRYRAICGASHPAMPQHARPQHGLGGTVHRKPSPGENQCLFVHRNGYPEEAFFAFSSTPIRDGAGGVGGVFQVMVETTQAVLAERRAGAARHVAKRLEGAETADEILGLAAAALGDHTRDVPFALFYRLERLDEAGFRYRLAGCAGLLDGTPANPEALETGRASPWPLAVVLTGQEARVVGGLAEAMQGLSCGPYPETPREAVVAPIMLPGSDLPVALMMAGISARLPLDEAYRGFHDQLVTIVGAALAREQARVEQRRRGVALAALDQAHAALRANLSQEFRAPLRLILRLVEDVLAEAPGVAGLPRLEDEAGGLRAENETGRLLPEDEAARLPDAGAASAGADKASGLTPWPIEAAWPRRDRRGDVIRTRSHEALRESERRLAFVLQAGRLGSWELDLTTRQLLASTICRTNLGLGEADTLDTHDDFVRRIHTDDRAMHQAAFGAAIASRSALAIECRVLRPDATVGWIEIRGQAVYDAAGLPLRMTGVSRDVTERKQAEERQKLLVDELNHRVKNTLAAVQSIAMQTLRSAESPAVFNENLTARIGALARAHDLLADAFWNGASLAEVIGKTIGLHARNTEAGNTGAGNTGAGRLIEADGSPVRLCPNAAVTLNLAFHELAANASKYGALSVPAGGVAVKWNMARDADVPTLEIVWREMNGPRVAPPGRRGFGSRLLERGLAGELGGEVRLDFAPGGVCCVMRFPISAKIAVMA